MIQLPCSIDCPWSWGKYEFLGFFSKKVFVASSNDATFFRTSQELKCLVMQPDTIVPCLKEHEHRRRQRTVSPVIVIKASAKVTCTSKEFLRNSGNKEELIKFISRRFEECCIEVKVLEDDAYMQIIKKAIQISQRPEVVVSSDDTYSRAVSVPLPRRFANMYFSTEIKEKTKKTELLQQRNVTTLASSLSYQQLMLFAYAWSSNFQTRYLQLT